MVLPPDLRQRLINIARAGLPYEVCGYVAGSRGQIAHAEAVHPVQNSLRSPVAFALDGQSMIDAEERIHANGQEIVAVFHSHPAGAAKPSATDREDAAIYDPQGHFIHVIISMQGFVPQIRAWRYHDGETVELALFDAATT